MHENVARLKQILELPDERARGTTCTHRTGLPEDCEQMLDEDGDVTVHDAGIVAAAHRVGHCEIASWGRALALATLMGHSGIDELLELSLNEEQAADAVLCAIAEEE